MISSQFILDVHGEMIIDNFAGGGGASSGIELALGRHVDVAINHDPEAVAMHQANHPQTKHYCESVWDINPREVTQGRPVGLVWLSPDCKHFSKAKGGKPVEKKIRGLAWVALRWAAVAKPRVIMLENVEEFVTWGPLIEDAEGNFRPCPKRKGQTFDSFKRALQRQGYAVEHKELRASDYGTPTIRKRLFLIARRDNQPIVWPAPTHGNPTSAQVKTKQALPWRTAAECIDWSIPCPSIFLDKDEARKMGIKRPLADATLRRVAKGIMRYVVNAAKPFIVNTANSKTTGRGPNVWSGEEPLRTITSAPGFAVVSPTLIQTGYGEREGQAPRAPGLDKPLGTVVAGSSKHALVSAFISTYYGDKKPTDVRGIHPDEPLHVQTTENRHAIVAANLIKNYTGVVGSDLADPIGTVTGVDHHSLVAASLVHMGHGEQSADGTKRWSHGVRDVEQPLNTVTANGVPAGLVTACLVGAGGPAYGGNPTKIDAPFGTLTTENHRAVVTSNLVKLRGGGNIGQADDEPLRTISAGGTHFAEVRAFLIKYYATDQDPRLEEPLHTVTTNDRFGLVTVAGQEYRIEDIGLRMLAPRELFLAQGFPKDYIIEWGVDPKGATFKLTKTAQVKMCGNSVCPPLAAALVKANLGELAIRRVA